MWPRYIDLLRNAVQIARFDSLSGASAAMNMTKGALSQQLKRLEADLGFDLFERHSKGLRLTRRGQDLLSVAGSAFEQITTKARDLRADSARTLTVGTTTYFASRWLSPRLMNFMVRHPDTILRLQPMIEPYDLTESGIDIAIRWGIGDWKNCSAKRLLGCPAWPTGNAEALAKVREDGVEAAFRDFALLHDTESGAAWKTWFAKAALPPHTRRDALVIPDPNVRVQAVIDGQGIALNDTMIQTEIDLGTLFRLHPVELEHYGYFVALPKGSNDRRDVVEFVDWITDAAGEYGDERF
ncbi:MAG: LysR substrate-binding domain-containing protein [Pseudomonadota bacterium]